VQSDEEEASGFELEMTINLVEGWDICKVFTNLETEWVSDASSPARAWPHRYFPNVTVGELVTGLEFNYSL